MMMCANSTGISPEGVAKLKQAVQSSKAEKDFRKRMKQLTDDAKKAVEETDKDKHEAYDKCLNEAAAKFPMKGRHHKGHGGAKGEEKADAKADEEAKPAEE